MVQAADLRDRDHLALLRRGSTRSDRGARQNRTAGPSCASWQAPMIGLAQGWSVRPGLPHSAAFCRAGGLSQVL
jgi:hypothetical protein